MRHVRGPPRGPEWRTRPSGRLPTHGHCADLQARRVRPLGGRRAEAWPRSPTPSPQGPMCPLQQPPPELLIPRPRRGRPRSSDLPPRDGSSCRHDTASERLDSASYESVLPNTHTPQLGTIPATITIHKPRKALKFNAIWPLAATLHNRHNGRGFRDVGHKARFLGSASLLMFCPER